MDEWEKIVKQKLENYQHSQGPDEGNEQRLFNELDERQQKPGFSWKIAASVVIIIGIGFLVYFSGNTVVVTGPDERVTHQLPGGSQVMLNNNSRISYNSLSWNFRRSTDLDGEAYFKVKKGSPFAVFSERGTTNVLGTAFNIYARADGYEVKCYEGQVQVELQNKKVSLEPGKGVEQTEVFTFDARAGTWTSGEIDFNARPLEEVIRAFNRQYKDRLTAPDSLLSLTYSGFFPIANRELALKLICEPLNLTYVVEENKITLYPAREE